MILFLLLICLVYGAVYKHERRFYVYVHSIRGTVFYVGKGSKDRAWSISNRNKLWWYVVNQECPDIGPYHKLYNHYKLKVTIVRKNLLEQQAYDHERRLIEEYGIKNLTNLQRGRK